MTLEEIGDWVLENTSFTLTPNQTYGGVRALSLLCEKGHRFTKRLGDLKRKSGCPFCSKKAKKSLEEVEAWVSANTSFQLLPDQKYEKVTSPLKFLCERGHVFSKSWSNISQGRGCQFCSGLIKKTIEGIASWVATNTLFHLLPDQKYRNSVTKLNFVCENGHVFSTRWNSLQQGKGCPFCQHKSETKLGHLLSNSYTVLPQYPITCPKSIRVKGLVYVDYFLPESNTIVEYHGEQHYKWLRHFHKTEKEFQDQQRRDQWLRGYCSKNQITYWEVSYLEFDHNSTELPKLRGNNEDV